MTIHRLKSKQTQGLSRVEWLSLLCVLLCILSYLLPQLIHTGKNKKIKDATENMRAIYDAQQAYFLRQKESDPELREAAYLTLPATPSLPSPLPQIANFDSSPWSLLGLDINSNVFFSYETLAFGKGSDAHFEIFARGDLDGDGHQSMLKMRGKLDRLHKNLGRDVIFKIDPLE